MRFTLATFLIAVAMLAAACAGMTYRTAAWTSVVISITLALYAIMTIRAIAVRGQSRAFALAFAVVGGGYLFLATTTLSRIQEFLITNYPLAAAARVTGLVLYVPAAGGGFFSIPSELGSSVLSLQQFGGGQTPVTSLDEIISIATSSAPYSSELQYFFLIGHCMWSWLFGLLAGWTSTSLWRRNLSGTAPESR